MRLLTWRGLALTWFLRLLWHVGPGLHESRPQVVLTSLSPHASLTPTGPALLGAQFIGIWALLPGSGMQMMLLVFLPAFRLLAPAMLSFGSGRFRVGLADMDLTSQLQPTSRASVFCSSLRSCEQRLCGVALWLKSVCRPSVLFLCFTCALWWVCLLTALGFLQRIDSLSGPNHLSRAVPAASKWAASAPGDDSVSTSDRL